MTPAQIISALSLGVAFGLPIFAFIVTGAARAYIGRERAARTALTTGEVSVLRQKRTDSGVFGHDWTLALFTLIAGAFLSVKDHLWTLTGWPEDAVLGLCVLILILLLCSYAGMVFFAAKMETTRPVFSRVIATSINSMSLCLFFLALYTLFATSLGLS